MRRGEKLGKRGGKMTYLDDERVGVFHVQMHDTHHGAPGQLRLERFAHLLHVVGVDRRGDELGLFLAAHGGWFYVFERCHVYLFFCQPMIWRGIRIDDGGGEEREREGDLS